jgi:hypothetical protein
LNFQLIRNPNSDPRETEGKLKIGHFSEFKAAKVANAANVIVIPPSKFSNTLAVFCCGGTAIAGRPKIASELSDIPTIQVN